MRCVRIWFTKTGESRFISHLDLMRCMSRAVRRARLPLWYTEGYNPHPYMTFALPLSLGMESLCESMDIRIEGEITHGEIKEALAAVMPQGLFVTDVREPVLDPKLIAYGEFEILFEGAEEGFRDKLSELLSADSFTVEKLGKQGHKKVMKQLELKEHLNNFCVEAVQDKTLLKIVLPAGSTVNINPMLIADAVNERIGEGRLLCRVTRKRLLTAEAKTWE